jgi:enoyl-CoA hydratase/carnithine racemase
MHESSESERVRLSVDAAGVAEVRLNRPEKMNALDPAMFASLVAVSERLRSEPRLRAVVLCGEGRAFCGGLDIASFGRMANQGGAGDGLADLAERTHGMTNLVQQVAWAWHTLPVPVVAAMQGAA